MALAAPIAAHYMVPDAEAAYAVITINGKVPFLTASMLGLELGVIAAILLTGLAYIFLRAGPTRHRPWQVMDVSPHSRVICTLGRWGADTLALWILLMALTCAGLIIGLFRLDSESNPLKTVVALWVPAAPSLALIAAIRLFLDARTPTRRWLGDVIFFFVWLQLTVTAIIGTIDPVTDNMISNPLSDAYGFTSPIIGSIDEPVTTLTIGGGANTGQRIAADAWRGVTATDYLMSRWVWLAIAAGIAGLAGLIWGPVKPRAQKRGAGPAKEGVPRPEISTISFSAPTIEVAKSSYYVPLFISNLKLTFRDKVWAVVLLVAALSAFFLPFRTVSGPVVFLALIFPLTDASVRWQNQTTQAVLDTFGPSRMERAVVLLITFVAIAAVAMLPSVVQLILTNELQWISHILVITLVLPVVIVALGVLTRTAVTGRLLMLVSWYAYLTAAS